MTTRARPGARHPRDVAQTVRPRLDQLGVLLRAMGVTGSDLARDPPAPGDHLYRRLHALLHTDAALDPLSLGVLIRVLHIAWHEACHAQRADELGVPWRVEWTVRAGELGAVTRLPAGTPPRLLTG